MSKQPIGRRRVKRVRRKPLGRLPKDGTDFWFSKNIKDWYKK